MLYDKGVVDNKVFSLYMTDVDNTSSIQLGGSDYSLIRGDAGPPVQLKLVKDYIFWTVGLRGYSVRGTRSTFYSCRFNGASKGVPGLHFSQLYIAMLFDWCCFQTPCLILSSNAYCTDLKMSTIISTLRLLFQPLQLYPTVSLDNAWFEIPPSAYLQRVNLNSNLCLIQFGRNSE
jgi:hypothetical protein